MPGTMPSGIEVYSCVVLVQGRSCLLLQRSPHKAFAGQWTGLGGRVEPAEFADLPAAAWRELAEEAGITPDHVERLQLRRVLLHARPGEVLTLLCYFTGIIRTLPPTLQPPLEQGNTLTLARTIREGALFWVPIPLLDTLPLIDNTRETVPLLLRDLAHDPVGHDSVHVGVARTTEQGKLLLQWA